MSPSGETALRIEVIGGEHAEAMLPEGGMLVVGSSSERAGLVVTGQGVEDAHCAIGKIKSGGWAIKDLGSRYGTLVNGTRVTSQRLEAGDLIVLGSRRLRIVDPSAPPAPVAPPTPAAAPAPAPSPTAAPAAAPGSAPARAGGRVEPVELPRIPGYTVERLLGRGGMGLVYRAVQESLHRPVALKILSPELAADRDFVRRFQSEARAAAAWNHPNVVVVHDVGASGGHHFLSMEYMPGGNLEQVVAAQGPLSWRRVLDVLHDAARGLAYAEAQGILHRDIKPANLMLSEAGAIKIADLGLATPVAAQSGSGDGPGGKIYGTPHFISPEQARGDRVDHRSDLYSLGATAYRLLTGQTPFQGETTREIVLARFTSDPVPPSELVPEIPADLDALVMRLMARSPDGRFASAEELLREVDRLRLRADHGEPVVITEVRRRSRVPLLVGGALVVVAAVVAVKLLAGRGGEPGGHGEGVANAGDGVGGFPPADEDFYGTGTEDEAGADADERALEVADLEAQIEYRDIPSSFSTEARIEALRELAGSFRGTDTAIDASEEADRLERELAEERAAEERLSRELDAELVRLRAAVDWPPAEGELPHPGPALRQLDAFLPRAGLALEPRFLEAKAALAAEIVQTSDHAFQAELERARGLAQKGDFDGVRESLRYLASRFDLPPAKADEPSGLAALRRLESEVGARLAAVPDEEEAYREERQRAERLELARTLGPASGFSDSLRAMDLGTLGSRLGAVESELVTENARTTLAPIAEDVARGEKAIRVLIDSFAAGEWRRQAIADPRPRRSGAADIVGVDDEGLMLAVDGQAERVSWSAFGRRAELVEQLFKGRLNREYTLEENADIVALLRLAAVGQAVGLASQVIDPAHQGILQPNEVDTMRAAFEPAENWLSDAGAGALAGESERLERERKAALVLADAIMAAQSKELSRSVATFEHLFRDFGDTLVVLLLSDGSGWREEPPPSPPDEPSDGAAQATGDTPGDG